MSNFVNTVDSVGDEVLTNSIIDRSITEILDNYVTSVGRYAFSGCSSLITVNFLAVTNISVGAFNGCSSLTTANFPVATNVNDSTFSGCSSLTTVNLPVVTRINNSTFQYCRSLTTVNLPVAESIGYGAFQFCSKLTTANFPAVTSIGDNAFQSCSSLAALILRSGKMVTLGRTSSFVGTPIKSGTGYIYVPSTLVDSYKAAANWSTYADQFRAIEDYPDICGG